MTNKDIFPRPGILIQLAEVNEDTQESEIQILKTGNYSHLYYGDFEITRVILAQMVSNFEKKAIKNDLMIDYNHECEEAAGWVMKLYTKEEGKELWALVKWTKPGKQHLMDKTYRYISADFNFNHMDNETLEEFGPVLYGAALTNRPFIKGMAPTVNLNELTGGNKMTLDELKKQNQQLTDRVTSLEEKHSKEVKTLSETISSKDEEIKTLKKENEDLQLGQEKAKKESEFAVLLSQGKAVPAQKEAFLAGDLVKFAELAGKTNHKESGSGQSGSEDVELTEDQKLEKVEKLADEKIAKKLASNMGEAISMVLQENPELA